MLIWLDGVVLEVCDDEKVGEKISFGSGIIGVINDAKVEELGGIIDVGDICWRYFGSDS